MYLCIYIATYLHTVYLDWQHAVIESRWRCARRWRSSELRDTLRGRDGPSVEMQLETEIERTRRCTEKPWSSKFGDALWGHDRASLEMQLETEIVWTQRCTGRPWSSEFGHALGGRDRAHWEMESELWSSEFRDALAGGYDRGRLEEYMEVVDIEAVDRRRTRCRECIHRLINSKPWECDKVTLPLKLLWNRENEWTTANPRCMLYLVYAALGICCIRCSLMMMAWGARKG